MNYKDWKHKPGDKLGNDIKITILSDAVTHPDKNQKYWQEIAGIITNHIKEK